jgi:hypothetical protein
MIKTNLNLDEPLTDFRSRLVNYKVPHIIDQVCQEFQTLTLAKVMENEAPVLPDKVSPKPDSKKKAFKKKMVLKESKDERTMRKCLVVTEFPQDVYFRYIPNRHTV